MNSHQQSSSTEQLEGFPLSPLQTLAWRRYAERPRNVVLIARLAAPHGVDALVDRLGRLCEEKAQLRVTYRALPGMSLPVQVLDGRDAASAFAWTAKVIEPEDPARLDEEADRLAEIPLGRDAEPALAASLLGHEPGAAEALVLAVPPFVADPDSLLKLARRLLDGPSGEPAGQDEEPLLFQHFSEWANESLEGEGGEAARHYWRERGVGEANVLALPERRAGVRQQAERIVSPALLDALAKVGLPEAGALLAWAQVAGQFVEDEHAPVALDRLIAGRVFNEFADLIGPFSARCPLAVERLADGSARERMKALADAILAQEEAAVLLDPFDAGPGDAASLAFAWVGGASAEPSVREARLHEPDTDHVLALTVLPDAGGRRARLTVRGAWGEGVAERLLDAWLQGLERIARSPDDAANRLPLVGAEEAAALQRLQGPVRREALPPSLIHALRETVARTPDAPAVVDARGTLSFADLQRRCDRLATALLDAGVRRGQPVAVMTERSVDAVVALLGIMGAGAVYAPLNPDFPPARIERMRDTAGIAFVVVDATHRARLDGLFEGGVLDIGALPERVADTLPALAPEDGAYLIFTSGSTGQPKGVLVEHASVLNLARALRQDVYNLDEGQGGLRVTVNAPFSFDSSIKQIIQVVAGHTLYPVPSETRTDPARMLAFLETHRIDVLDCTPSLFRLLIQAGLGDGHPALPGRIMVGGEWFDEATWQVARRWTRCEVFNLYGPTETTVNATAARVRDHESSTLGRPLSNVAAYVVDPLGRQKSQGAAGELWIGGAGVARGYVGDPALTAARFLDEPWPGGGRIYRSGDLARWRADGCLDFLGRLDEQVKVNGYRIELGDIRSALLEHPGVGEAAVVTDDEPGDRSGDRRLAAFVVPRRAAAEGQDWLEVDLPSGHRVAGLNLNETEYVFNEIFVDQVYSRDGIVLPPDAVVLDVGANIGLFSLFVASRAPSARIVAFEPLEPIRRRLVSNLERYAPQVRVCGIGLSDREREETFTYYPGYSTFSGQSGYADAGGEREVIRRYLSNQAEGEDSAHLLLDNIDEILDDRLRAEAHRCHLRRLDQVIRELDLSRIDLLKIDVQRAEMDVLLGLDAETFGRIAQIVMEVHDKRDGATAGRVEQLRELLGRHGFEVEIRQDALLEGTDRYNCYAVRPGYADSLARRVDWQAEPVRPVAATAAIPEALPASLKSFLEARLPAYMVPARIAVVPALPLTAEGKLDRRALLSQQAQADRQRSVEAPENELEASLADIWAQVLKRPVVGVTDNFFQIGGDSIRLIQMQVTAREAGFGFSLRDVFGQPTIRELARLLKTRDDSPVQAPRPAGAARHAPFAQLASADRKVLPEGLDDAYPMTRLQLGMVVQTEAAHDPRLLHNVVLHRARGRFDARLLTRAWGQLVARHPILRTSYVLEGYSEPLQFVHRVDRVPVEVAVHDLGALAPSAQSERLRQYLEAEHRTPFDWGRAPLIRVAALRLGDDRFALGVAEHHSALDGWSLQQLVNEWIDAYAALLEGREAALAPLPEIAYGDYVALERQAEGNAEAALFWFDYLVGAHPVGLPSTPAKPGAERRVAAKRVEVPADTLASLRGLGERTGLPLRSLLLAAHGRALGWLTGSPEVITGFVTHGRPEEPNAERILGLFLNTVPCRLHTDRGLVDIARQAFDFEKRMLEHRRYPLAAIRRRNREASFDSLFNFVDFHQDDRPASAGRPVAIEGVIDQVVVDVDVPLAVDFEVRGERLELGFQYDARRFDEDRATRFAQAYRHALEELLAWRFDEPRVGLSGNAGRHPWLPCVLNAFARALGRPVVETERFFDAGGHSLLAVRVVAELRQATGRRLGLDLLQNNPCALDVARRCEEAPRAPSESRLPEAARSLWVQRHVNPDARLRLFAFPPAGGNAGTYGGWLPHLPADVELVTLQYPGRQARQDEPFVTDFERMVGLLVEALRPLLDKPFVLLGASLGGVLAYEVACRLRDELGALPERLVVVSSRAPSPSLSYPPFHAMGDETLTHLLRDYDALPSEVLGDRELLAITLATLRADSRLSADYRYRPHEALEAPITVILGEQDKGVSRAQVEGWGALTIHGQDLETLPGGHGIVVTAAEALCRLVAERLRGADLRATERG